MKLSDMADDVRMSHRDTIELAGGMVDGYDGEWFRVAIPCPSRPFYDAMNDAGWECDDKSLHFFPLGSDSPPAEYRHDGSYRGSKGFWLYGRFCPPADELEHEHQWAPFEHSRLAGTVHRKCQVSGCKAINLDGDDDDDDVPCTELTNPGTPCQCDCCMAQREASELEALRQDARWAELGMAAFA